MLPNQGSGKPKGSFDFFQRSEVQYDFQEDTNSVGKNTKSLSFNYSDRTFLKIPLFPVKDLRMSLRNVETDTLKNLLERVLNPELLFTRGVNFL